MLFLVFDTAPPRIPQECHAIESHIFPAISGVAGDTVRGGL